MRKFTKIVCAAMSVVFAAAAFTGCGSQPPVSGSSAPSNSPTLSGLISEKPKIGIVQLVEHPSLDTIREACLAKLAELGYKDGENCTIDYKNAGGDATMSNTIVQNFAGDPKDIIVAIATPTAQAAATVSDKIPVIFSAVSYPIEAELVQSLEHPGGNITGTSDEIQVELILELAMKYNPDLKKLGVIYNTGEANSVTNLAKAKAFCESHNIELVEAVATNTNEVPTAAQVLCSKVDAVFAPNDNTVASAMPALAQAAISAGIPVYTGADSMVLGDENGEGGGGFATIGINYEDLGKETAVMVDQVLRGAKAGDIPVKVFKDNLNTIYNEETAKALGIEIQK